MVKIKLFFNLHFGVSLLLTKFFFVILFEPFLPYKIIWRVSATKENGSKGDTQLVQCLVFKIGFVLMWCKWWSPGLYWWGMLQNLLETKRRVQANPPPPLPMGRRQSALPFRTNTFNKCTNSSSVGQTTLTHKALAFTFPFALSSH